jgi:hypothetical protein
VKGEPKDTTPAVPTTAAVSAEKDKGDEPVASAGDKQAWAFHVVMLLASLYMAMLLTNWGALTVYVYP